MTKPDRLQRLIGCEATLQDVADAFSGSLSSEDRQYEWAAQAELRGDAVLIRGTISTADRIVGRYARRLVFEEKAPRAIHEIIEIADEGHHRGRGIAMAHYRAAIAFYERVGIRIVELNADGIGTYIWPMFGFHLRNDKQRQRLLAIMRRSGLESPPSIDSILAPQVVDITVDGDDVGRKALTTLGELAGNAGQEIPMYLDLADPVQRRYLHSRGILERGGSK